MTPAHHLVPFLTPARRARLYRIASAAVALLLIRNLITGPEASAVLELLGALLVSGTAALHTPTPPKEI